MLNIHTFKIQELHLLSKEDINFIVSHLHHMFNNDECDIHMDMDIDVYDHKTTIYRFPLYRVHSITPQINLPHYNQTKEDHVIENNCTL